MTVTVLRLGPSRGDSGFERVSQGLTVIGEDSVRDSEALCDLEESSRITPSEY